MQEAMQNCIQNIKSPSFPVGCCVQHQRMAGTSCTAAAWPYSAKEFQVCQKCLSHMQWEGPVVILKVQLEPFIISFSFLYYFLSCEQALRGHMGNLSFQASYFLRYFIIHCFVFWHILEILLKNTWLLRALGNFGFLCIVLNRAKISLYQ